MIRILNACAPRIYSALACLAAPPDANEKQFATMSRRAARISFFE